MITWAAAFGGIIILIVLGLQVWAHIQQQLLQVLT